MKLRKTAQLPLGDAVAKHGGRQAQSLKKHLEAYGIVDWKDITRVNLMGWVDYIKGEVSPSSAKTYAASLAAILHRYEDERLFECRTYPKILSLKGEKPVKTYLTVEEIERLERVQPESIVETYVLNSFLVGLKTGARLSDLLCLDESNVQGGVLTYTSKKTGVTASVPCSKMTIERLRWLKMNGREINTSVYDRTIKRLCQRAGIDSVVKVHKGGKDVTGPKWQFISSHSARISVATNLAIAQTPLEDIRAILGHTNGMMTERYVCDHEIVLNEKSLELFK